MKVWLIHIHRSFIYALILFLLQACIAVPRMGSRDNVEGSSPQIADSNLPVPGAGGGSQETPGSVNDSDGGDLNVANDLFANGRAELRHLVDPFDGTYKTKVTIPKNFTGFMYLSGLNITSLSDRLIYVRFKFGRELEPIMIPATIGRGEGITPQTDIEVVILDIQDKPFENIRLLYDLFDYNDYDVDEDGNTDGVEQTTPVTDPRNNGLYCRGLHLQNDPTFVGTTCASSGQRCLYSYAKIVDNGLALPSATNPSTYVSLIPSEPSIDLKGSGYTSMTQADALKKCLPDSNKANDLNRVLGGTSDINTATAMVYDSFLTSTIIKSSADYSTYKYRGPFRTIASSMWEISGAAIFSNVTDGAGSITPSGIFQKSLSNDPNDFDPQKGYRSFLFPRDSKLDLKSGVEHFASSSPFGTKSLTTLTTGGASGFVDGCNVRVRSYDAYSNESISSCNVTAAIELVTYDKSTGAEIILNSSNSLKLQLIRPSLLDYQGREVLYSAMTTCSSSAGCATNECCYNNRCWSKELVSQCIEDAVTVGNLGIGLPCTSDYECSSLCCNQSTGACSVHINNNTEQNLCGKAPGQKCVAKEWCRRENVTECNIYKTGTSATGALQCALRCFTIPTFGRCLDGTCIPPATPAIPTYDPNSCTTALDLPN